MKSSPLARRWSACRSHANTNDSSTSLRSTVSAASSACSSTTAKRSPSIRRWSSVSLVSGPASDWPLASSTGWCSKSLCAGAPLPAAAARFRSLPPFGAGFVAAPFAGLRVSVPAPSVGGVFAIGSSLEWDGDLGALPLLHLQAPDDLREHLHDGGVELRAGAGVELGDGLIERARRAVRPVGRH